MKTRSVVAGVILVVAVVLVAYTVQAQNNAAGERREAASAIDPAIANHARQTLENGRRVFRLDTFGSEAFWGETLQLHRAIASAKNGGVGDGVSPKTALSVGLKVDADALPAPLKRGIKDGKVDLDDPATTLALLKLNSVVGVTGLFDNQGNLASMGLQCALCHSTVDDSFTPGIGKPPATSRRSSPIPDTTCTRPARSEWTRSWLTAHRPICTGPRPSPGSGPTQEGGFYHDGRFATLRDVLEHYDAFYKLGLSEREKTELTEYRKSL